MAGHNKAANAAAHVVATAASNNNFNLTTRTFLR